MDFHERMTEIHSELLELQKQGNDLMATIDRNFKGLGLLSSEIYMLYHLAMASQSLGPCVATELSSLTWASYLRMSVSGT